MFRRTLRTAVRTLSARSCTPTLRQASLLNSDASMTASIFASSSASL
jgi:hypothetical protein